VIVAMPMRVLELRSVRGTGGGPEKTILLGAAQATPGLCHVTVCYIRDERDDQFGIDRRAASLGVDYVEIRERHSFDLSVWPTLRQLVRAKNIDLVHAHDYKTDLLAWMLHRRDGTAVMSTAHGWSGFSFKERCLYYPGDKYLLARLPRVVAVSPLIRDELLSYGADPDRVTVLLNSIDPEAFRRDDSLREQSRASLPAGSRDFVIGAVGRLEIEKRFDLLMQAFATVVSRQPRARLVIAGEGSLRTSLEDLASRLGVADRCHLIGQVSDVALLHQGLDACVQTSDTEGTPNSVLEAMAMRTPVVATAAGGTTALVTHNVHGLIVPVGDVAAIADALETVIVDPAAAARHTQAARERIERDLSFRARTATLEGIYAELLGRRAGRTAA
jgi:glycosyltransferase involved in cell wall biosynthesis